MELREITAYFPPKKSLPCRGRGSLQLECDGWMMHGQSLPSSHRYALFVFVFIAIEIKKQSHKMYGNVAFGGFNLFFSQADM